LEQPTLSQSAQCSRKLGVSVPFSKLLEPKSFEALRLSGLLGNRFRDELPSSLPTSPTGSFPTVLPNPPTENPRPHLPSSPAAPTQAVLQMPPPVPYSINPTTFPHSANPSGEQPQPALLKSRLPSELGAPQLKRPVIYHRWFSFSICFLIPHLFSFFSHTEANFSFYFSLFNNKYNS
jgi:hypothetical protein